MTDKKMTRTEALVIAMDAISDQMALYLTDAQLAAEGKPHYPKRAARYAELAAALQVIEHMARQQEMHL